MFKPGKQCVDRSKLAGVESVYYNTNGLPRTWIGVQHGFFADLIIANLKGHGWIVVNDTWYLGPNHKYLFGSITLAANGFKHTALDFGTHAILCVDVLNSNDGRRPVMIQIGARVVSNGNGVVANTPVYTRNHSWNINLEQFVYETFMEDKFVGNIKALNTFVQMMRATPISVDEERSLIVELYHNEILQHNQVIDAIDACSTTSDVWRVPECSEPTLWGLYNKIVYVMGEYSIPTQFWALQSMHKVFADHTRRTQC